MIRYIFAIISVVLILSCKKNQKNSSTNLPSKNIATVYINGNDPRLAQLRTTDGEILTFYGKRDLNGTPIKLTSYQMSSTIDSLKYDYVSFDDSGRYVNIALKTGENLHFDYSETDSVITTFVTLDTLIKITTAYNNSISHISKNGLVGFISKPKVNGISGTTTGIDHNINVQVFTENTFTQKLVAVTGNETTVWADFVVPNRMSVSVPLEYNPSTGFYFNTLSAAGFDYSDPYPLEKTFSVIKKALDSACSDPNSGDNQIDKSVPEFLNTLCEQLQAYPEICLALNAVVIVCQTSKVYEVLNEIIDFDGSIMQYIDPNTIPINDAMVFVTSQHEYYPKVVSEATTVSKILQDLTPPDITITHVYTNNHPLPSLIGTTYSLVSEETQSVPGDINVNITRCDGIPPYITYQGEILLNFVSNSNYIMSVYDSSGLAYTENDTYSIGQYHSDSLFISGAPYDCTNSYGHQFPEGWGTKWPPGFDLQVSGVLGTGRLSLDGSQIYSAADYIFRK